MSTPRQRFLSFVRDQPGADPVCSPFLPHPTVIQDTLRYLGQPVGSDDIRNEVRLAAHLDYQPMFTIVCEQVGGREAEIRAYYRDFRRRTGEGGVIVEAVDGSHPIYSTADGVLEGTPPENYLSLIQTIHDATADRA